MKNIIYYTHNLAKNDIEKVCRKQLLKLGLPIISVSLNKEIDFGDVRITTHGEPGPEMMFRDILIGLISSRADTVFFCESDILYHKTHFDFSLPKDDTFFYNVNFWRIHYPDGNAVFIKNLHATHSCCCNRKLAISYYQRRLEEIREIGRFNRRYEADVRTGEKSEDWTSVYPNLDIKHDKNFCGTGIVFDEKGTWVNKWGKPVKESCEVDGWGNTKFADLVKNI